MKATPCFHVVPVRELFSLSFVFQTFLGDFPRGQGLELGAFTAWTQVQSLFGELRFHKPL